MAVNITLWHNPRCSKSRQALALLTEHGCSVTILKYLETPPNHDDIQQVAAKLNRPLIDMIRVKDAAFKELQIDPGSDDATLIAAMVKAPAIIERPIAISHDAARLGRPPEDVLELL